VLGRSSQLKDFTAGSWATLGPRAAPEVRNKVLSMRLGPMASEDYNSWYLGLPNNPGEDLGDDLAP
jgi:hypothetical protein